MFNLRPFKKPSSLIISAFALFSFPLVVRAQFPEIHSYHTDPGGHERNRNIDVTHMKVEVKFDVYKKTVIGKVTHTFNTLQKTIDTIFFDAPGIQIVSATWDGRPLKYRIITEGVVVLPNFQEDIALPINRNKVPAAKKKGKSAEPSITYAKPNHQIVFEYIATPKKGIYFSGYSASNGQILSTNRDAQEMIREQIWTQGQGIDNRNWIPMIDDRSDKFITETVVTHDSKHQVLSNGALKSKKVNTDGTTTWHYALSQPHAGYLLMLGIGNYAVQRTQTPLGTPMQFWYYPEHPEKLEPTARYSEKIIDFLSTETGIPYPWGTYSQVMVQDFLYGAMENTSATTFGDFFWVDKKGFQDRNYIEVNAHEATHQWFGDFITGRHDGEQWLQESFATYYPGLFMGSIYGQAELDWYFRNQMKGGIAAGKANSLPVRHSASGSSRHYPKGASVLHMLRYVLGDDNFRRSINHYLSQHSFATVETWDLQKAIMDETGINMDWFFDQWIHRGGEPIYAVDWNSHNVAGLVNTDGGTPLKNTALYEIEVNISQKQVQDAVVGLFRMPVDIELLFADGSSEVKRVWVSEAHHTFRFNVAKGVKTVIFDAGSHVLKTLETKKSQDEWLWQLSYGKNMLDRYDALLALRAFPESSTSPWKLEVLQKAWTNENFREMQVEIARQWMGLYQSDNSAAKLSGNSEVSKSVALTPNTTAQLFSNSVHSAVRRVFYEQAILGNASREFFIQGLRDSSYANAEFVIDRVWHSADLSAEQTAAGISRSEMLEIIKNDQGHLHNVKIKYLECAYEFALIKAPNGEVKSAENDAQVYVNMLKDMAGPYYEFRTRIQAMSALKRLNYLDIQLAHYLFDAVLGFNSRLAQPATELIQYFKQNSEYKSLFLNALSKPHSINGEPAVQYAPADLQRLFRLLQ